MTARIFPRSAIRGAALAASLVMTTGAAAQQKTWTINGPAMPLREFIAQVAEITGRTIVVDPRVKKQEVAIYSSTPLDAAGVYELFLTVIKVNNFSAEVNDDMITISQLNVSRGGGEVFAEDSDLPHDLRVIRVVPVKHVPSTELVKTLRPLVGQHSLIAGIANPNVLIVASYVGTMQRVLDIVEQIDLVDADEVVHRTLEHAWVGTVATLLEEIDPELLGKNSKGPDRVQIVANERNNSLILKGKARPIANALRLVDKLDVPDSTGSGATVIHVNHADAVKLADILTNLVDRASGSGEATQSIATIQADEDLNALIVRANPTTLNELLTTVRQLDVRRAQVLIEVAVVEFSVSDVDSRGVELAAGDARGRSVPLMTTTLNGIISGLLTRIGETKADANIDPVAAAAGFASPTIAVAKLDRDGISFGAVVSALLSDTRANLLSTPSVLTLDNAEATYFSGQNVPFRTGEFTTTADGSRNPFQTINREEVGVTLEVTPHVHEDLSMQLVLNLTVGNVVNSPEGATFSDVVTAERKLETTVLADDKQIILLGGLIQDDYRDIRRKVPLLGNIPLLGRAFRSKRQTLMKSHLLMFLRPTVLLSGADAESTALRRYDGIYRLRGNAERSALEDLQSMFDGTTMPNPDAEATVEADAGEDGAE